MKMAECCLRAARVSSGKCRRLAMSPTPRPVRCGTCNREPPVAYELPAAGHPKWRRVSPAPRVGVERR
jgi:hypothetical protein